MKIKSFTFTREGSKLKFYPNDVEKDWWDTCIDAVSLLAGDAGSNHSIPQKYRNGIRIDFESGTIEPIAKDDDSES